MSDTTAEASARQTDIRKRLSGVERLQIAFEMSVLVRDLASARLRHEHPDWPESEIKRELLRYAFLSEPLPPPLR